MSSDIYASLITECEDIFTAFQEQYGRLSPVCAGSTQLFPATFLVHWQLREFWCNFCISEPGVFCCYRDFLTTWWVLPCAFFPTYMSKQAGSQDSATTALSSMGAVTSATSANCSSLRGAVSQSTQLLQLNVKAPSKPGAITPESSS